MTASDLNRRSDLLSLASGDTTLRRQGAYHVGPCPFCGGRDRFSIKATPDGYRWYCRKCGGGKYHTAIDYVMRRQRLDFSGAVRALGGDSGARPPAEPAKPASRGLPRSAAPAEWQRAAWREVDAAAERLLSEDGEQGRLYLLGRGLQSSTWLAWLLGFAHIYDPRAKRRRPAVVLPWFDTEAGAEIITALKYRFTDEDPDGLRYISRRGSVPILYGLWTAVRAHETLLLVEGEFNALSIWQCLLEGVTCLSFGSETGTQPSLLAAAARGYRDVFLWADDPTRATTMRAALGRQATALQSPRRGDLKLDANAMLVRGVLPEFLRAALR